MQIAAIAEGCAAIGLKISGAHTEMLDDDFSPAEASQKFNELITDSELFVLLLSNRVAIALEKNIAEFRSKSDFPIILEIPDINNENEDSGYIGKFISESIGLKV